MIRPLSTYLLLILTCSFFTLSLNEMQLDKFGVVPNSKIIKAPTQSTRNCTFIDAKENSFPVQESVLIGNFDVENEVEVETDVLPTIELTPYNFNFKNLQGYFLNVYTTYSSTVIKVEFLDIFSPPPNC